jgi:hypothetical protein
MTQKLLTFTALMMLCASVAAGAGSLGAPVHSSIDALRMSEPGGLVVLGVAFVVLARQIRRKNG